MYRKITAIVLNVMKYSDKNSIAHVYSDECGRMALLVPQGSTRGARMRNAAFMPLFRASRAGSLLGSFLLLLCSMFSDIITAE